jgi:hypothetical protein
MAGRVSARLLERADITELIGAGNEGKMRDNHLNHARFFGAMLEDFSPGMFLDTVHWVYRTYRSHGFHPRYWPEMLPLWLEVMRDELPAAAFDAIAVFYRWLAEHHDDLIALSDSESAWESGGV